jgi:hypothetical protein
LQKSYFTRRPTEQEDETERGQEATTQPGGAARLPLHRHHQKSRFGTTNSVLAPCLDGDLEEIFITIITDISPSTIHDSLIHV